VAEVEVDLSTDKAVAAWLLGRYRGIAPHTGEHQHLRQCPEAVLTPAEAYDGTYGCDTGCEYYTLEAVVSCPHTESPVHWSYGEFGDLAGFLVDFEGWADVYQRGQ
jgi:hypothetical protein